MTTLPASTFEPLQQGIWSGLGENVYHNHKAAPEISRSLIVEMALFTPAHVKASIDGTKVKKVTPAMQLGTLVDKALLEPDRFKEGVSHWLVPEGMKLSTKDGIAWKKDHPDHDEPGGLPRLKFEQSKDIAGMIESVMKHKRARFIIENSSKQESTFARDPDTGLMRKCRPDNRLVDADGRLTIADLKSTFLGGTATHVWSGHCARMGYHIQDSFYGDIYHDMLGEAPFFIFLVVERKPPYAVRVFQIHAEGKQAGREEYKRAMEKFARCKHTGNWPCYPDDIEVVKLPRWALIPTESVEE